MQALMPWATGAARLLRVDETNKASNKATEVPEADSTSYTTTNSSYNWALMKSHNMPAAARCCALFHAFKGSRSAQSNLSALALFCVGLQIGVGEPVPPVLIAPEQTINGGQRARNSIRGLIRYGYGYLTFEPTRVFTTWGLRIAPEERPEVEALDGRCPGRTPRQHLHLLWDM